jgi:hypothetical protein
MLASVDMDDANADGGPGRRFTSENAGMCALESAASDELVAGDELVVDDMAPVGESAAESLVVRTPLLKANW